MRIPGVPLITEELTPEQLKLLNNHGTPSEFAISCIRAFYTLMITEEEAVAAIAKYNREWEEAGRESAPVSV